MANQFYDKTLETCRPCLPRCAKCTNEYNCQQCEKNYRNFYVPDTILDPLTKTLTNILMYTCINTGIPEGGSERGVQDHTGQKMFHQCSNLIKNCQVCKIMGTIDSPEHSYRCLKCFQDSSKDRFEPENLNLFVFNRITNPKLETLYDVTGTGKLELKNFTNVDQDSCICRYTEYYDANASQCRRCGLGSNPSCRTCDTRIKCTSCYKNWYIRKEADREVYKCVKACGDGYRVSDEIQKVQFSYQTDYASNWAAPTNSLETLEQKWCSPCHIEHCAKCSSSLDKCSDCKHGYFRYNFICVRTCPETHIGDYYGDKAMCIPCSDYPTLRNCELCETSNRCKKCFRS
jgi:hypothetical protein